MKYILLLMIVSPFIGIGQGAIAESGVSLEQWVTQKDYNLSSNDETPKTSVNDYIRYSKSASRGKTAGVFFIAAGVIMTAIAAKNPADKQTNNLLNIGIGSASLGLVAYIAGSGSQYKADKILRSRLK